MIGVARLLADVTALLNSALVARAGAGKNVVMLAEVTADLIAEMAAEVKAAMNAAPIAAMNTELMVAQKTGQRTVSLRVGMGRQVLVRNGASAVHHSVIGAMLGNAQSASLTNVRAVNAPLV